MRIELNPKSWTLFGFSSIGGSMCFLHINWQTTFVDSPFPISIIPKIFKNVKQNVKIIISKLIYFKFFIVFYQLL